MLLRDHKFNYSRRNGFTLLEVLISIGILSTILTALLVSQSDTAGTLTHVGKLAASQKFVRFQISTLARSGEPLAPGYNDGEFEKGHELFGARWKRRIKAAKILSLPVLRISYEVEWNEKGILKSYESSAYVEINR